MGGWPGMYATKSGEKISVPSSAAPWLNPMARRTSALFASVAVTFSVMIGAPRSRRGRRRDDAQLLHHAELVPAGPVLDPLACPIEAGDDHYAYSDRLPGGRDAEQRSGMRASHAEPAGHAVALRDHLFHRAVQIRYPLP